MATEHEPVPWWHATVSVFAALLFVWIGWTLVLVALDALHLVPYEFGDPSGYGWPWRVDSAWALLAGLGPWLAAGFLFAGVTCRLLTQRNGVHSSRWPLALVAVFLCSAQVDGLDVLGSGGAFCVLVIAAHSWSATERRPMPWSRALFAALATAVVLLGAVSISYGTLHPLKIRYEGYPPL